MRLGLVSSSVRFDILYFSSNMNLEHVSFNFIAAAHTGDDVGDVDVDVMQLAAEQPGLKRKHVWCFHILPYTPSQ